MLAGADVVGQAPEQRGRRLRAVPALPRPIRPPAAILFAIGIVAIRPSQTASASRPGPNTGRPKDPTTTSLGRPSLA